VSLRRYYRPTTGRLWVAALGALVGFLFAVQLLGAATTAAAPTLRDVFATYVVGDARALGLGWLATYLLTNGSVVAAVSVSLYDAGLTSASQLFMLLAGTRLGGAAVVVLVGALDFLQARSSTFTEAVSLGLLAFVLTHSVFLPATAVGALVLPGLADDLPGLGSAVDLPVEPLSALDPLTVAVVEAVGALPAFALALGLLFASLGLFNAVLGRVDTGWLRHHLFRRFRHRWVAFLLGVFVTGATTSVAFSLGVVVPLYNRGYLERREVVPYVLGANLGTFADTLVVAVVLDAPVAVALVLATVGLGTLFTLAALVAFDAYVGAVETVQDRLLADPRAMLAVVGTLVVVPVALSLVPV